MRRGISPVRVSPDPGAHEPGTGGPSPARYHRVVSGSFEKRRDRRFPVRLPAVVVHRQHSFVAMVVDVGFRGVLLQAPAPPPLRELLLLRFRLPPEHRVVEFHGMAVRGITDPLGDGVFGVQFFAVPPDARRRWDDFVHALMPLRSAIEERVTVDLVTLVVTPT